ncbi:MAG: hypothetical protein ACRD4Y_07800, partial [Candidatus Acidiferrales bacterium]
INSDSGSVAEFVASGAALNLSVVTLINTGIGSGQVTAIGCVNNAPACNMRLSIAGYVAENGPLMPGLMSDSSTGGFEVSTQHYANISRGQFFLEDTQAGANPANVAMAELFPTPTNFTVTGTGSGSLSAGTWCGQISGVDARGMETLPTPPMCQAVGASGSISYSWQQGPLAGAYSGFNFYYCTTGGASCTPNTKLTSVAPAGVDPVTYTFSSTSGGAAGSPNANSQAYLSWLAWDGNVTPYSCFYCTSTVKNQSDLWPIGIGVLPTPNLGVNLFAQKGIKVGTATFSSLVACGNSLEGAMRAVTDSTTSTWGATITGGGANHVLAYCDGTNWTVAGK